MSILRVADDGALHYTGVESLRYREPGECCFYCGRQFHPDDGQQVLVWAGAGGPAMPAAELDLNLPRAFSDALGMVSPALDVYLHAECAVELWLRLSRDLYELERATDMRFCFAPRRTTAARRNPRASSTSHAGD